MLVERLGGGLRDQEGLDAVMFRARARLVAPGVRESMTAAFRELGFKYVTIDLDGIRSGSMNAVIPLESLVLGGSRR